MCNSPTPNFGGAFCVGDPMQFQTCETFCPGIEVIDTKNCYTNESMCRRPTERVAQSGARLTQEPEVSGSYPIRPHTFISPSADSRRTVVGYW